MLLPEDMRSSEEEGAEDILTYLLMDQEALLSLEEEAEDVEQVVLRLLL